MQKQIVVLGIDLGANLGWSKCVCTLRPELHINVTDHGTILFNKLTNDWMKQNYNEVLSTQRVRLNLFEELMRKLINNANYDCFATEAVFCNANHVTAFRNLALYMDIFERIVNNEKQKRIYCLTPTQIKKYISNFGHADKTQVSNAIMGNDRITMKRPHEASEHEFDSVAVVWGFINEFLLTDI